MLTSLEKCSIRDLRSKGCTYREIIDQIGEKIPKSTLAYICKDVSLPKAYYKKIQTNNLSVLVEARKKALIYKAVMREKQLEQIKKQNAKFERMTQREATLALAFLYLGEGLKRSSTQRGLRLGSSDPKIIRTYIGLLKRCYGIETPMLKCRISYRADQDLNELQKFWASITGINIDKFYKTKPDPRTVGKPTRKSDYKGVFAIYCAGSRIQLELQVIADIINDAMGY